MDTMDELGTSKTIRVALLDLYEGVANEGMRCLRTLIQEWSVLHEIPIFVEEFDVRLQQQLPGLNFDVYISSGGPGSPLASDQEPWENNYFKWVQQLVNYNQTGSGLPKHVLFICHSFQLACRFFEVGNVCKRKSTAFGIFPIHMLESGISEPVFAGLSDPFYGVDSRDYQVIEPDYTKIRELGATILAIEKNRPHVPYERAIMAMRFNEWFIGTQFHPEADAVGMQMYLQRSDKKATIIENHGEAKWQSMVEHLQDPDKILWTYQHVVPNFLNLATAHLIEQMA
ncbi:MAG: GMP synthase [Chitinophagia bacterium]|jgi:GMP synthase-like glutamine amidotransferase